MSNPREDKESVAKPDDSKSSVTEPEVKGITGDQDAQQKAIIEFKASDFSTFEGIVKKFRLSFLAKIFQIAAEERASKEKASEEKASEEKASEEKVSKEKVSKEKVSEIEEKDKIEKIETIEGPRISLRFRIVYDVDGNCMIIHPDDEMLFFNEEEKFGYKTVKWELLDFIIHELFYFYILPTALQVSSMPDNSSFNQNIIRSLAHMLFGTIAYNPSNEKTISPAKIRQLEVHLNSSEILNEPVIRRVYTSLLIELMKDEPSLFSKFLEALKDKKLKFTESKIEDLIPDPKSDEDNGVIKDGECTSCVFQELHKLAQAEREKDLKERNEIFEYLIHDDPCIEFTSPLIDGKKKIKVLKILKIYINFAHSVSMSKLPKLPSRYLQALARRAINLVIGNLKMQSGASPSTILEIIKENILHTNAPELLGAIRIYASKLQN